MTPTAQDLQRYARDPMAFFSELTIPAAHGNARFDTVWAPFQVDMFEQAAPCLLAVAAGKKPTWRGLWLERTKGASKDSDVGLLLLWLLLFSPRPVLAELGADDFDQIMETSKAMADVIRLNPWMSARIDVQRQRILCKPTGSVCEFLTTDEFGAHGSRPSVTVCNELAHVQSETFMLTLMDNASKLPNNLTIIATNAGSLSTWQHRWRESYRTDDRWYFQKVTEIPPWIDSKDVAASARRNPPSRQARLYGGIWAAPGGDLLPIELVDSSFQSNLKPMTGSESGFLFVGGVDLGLSRDAAAVVGLAVRTGGKSSQIFLAHNRLWQPTPGNRVSFLDVEQHILDLDRLFGLECVGFDPWQMAHLAETLEADTKHRRRNQRRRFWAEPWLREITPNATNLRAQASLLIESIEDRRLRLYPEPNLHRDLRQVRIEEKNLGYRLVSDRDEFGHADTLSAFTLALIVADDIAGRKPVHVGVSSFDDNTRTPRENALANRRALQALHELNAEIRR